MKKRGLSHIEVILSFIIFIGAVGFALYFFSPTNSSRLVDTSMDYVNREISKNITVNLKTYSINVNNSNGQLNGQGNNVLTVNITRICENANWVIIAENLSGDTLQSKVGNGDNKCNSRNDENDDIVFIKNDNWAAEDFVYVKLSEDLNQDQSSASLGGNPHPDTNLYRLSTVNSEDIFSEKRILNLNKTYYEDYYGLKKQFNLPGRVNFGFSFSFTNGDEIKAENMIPSGLDVFSKVDRVEVLRKNGKVEYADFIMKVW